MCKWHFSTNIFCTLSEVFVVSCTEKFPQPDAISWLKNNYFSLTLPASLETHSQHLLQLPGGQKPR